MIVDGLIMGSNSSEVRLQKMIISGSLKPGQEYISIIDLTKKE